jgi:hypothetical protein
MADFWRGMKVVLKLNGTMKIFYGKIL